MGEHRRHPRGLLRLREESRQHLIGAGGPPYAIYLSQRGLTKEQFRATLGLATLTSISLRAVAFLLPELDTRKSCEQLWPAVLAPADAKPVGNWR